VWRGRPRPRLLILILILISVRSRSSARGFFDPGHCRLRLLILFAGDGGSGPPALWHQHAPRCLP